MKLDILKKKIIGPVFSIITPFLKNEQIDYRSLESYIKFLYSRGARVFYTMFYNSRLGLLEEKEILELNEFIINKVKKLDSENIIIAAEPYHCSTKKSLEYIKIFHKYGADLVSCIFGEKYYSNLQVYEHFKYLNDNSPLPLLLHQQLLENGISGNPSHLFYPLDLLNKICNLNKFIAMKEDAKNKNYTRDIALLLSKKITIITSGSGKKQWMHAQKYGAQSWLSGISNLDPQIATFFYDNFKIGNKKICNLIIDKLETPFFDIKKDYGWHLTIKSFMEHLKLMKRFERRPIKHLSNKDHLKIFKKLEIIRENNKNYFKNKFRL